MYLSVNVKLEPSQLGIIYQADDVRISRSKVNCFRNCHCQSLHVDHVVYDVL